MTEDPNVVTNAEGETIVLEPGDEGYVEPRTEEPEIPRTDVTDPPPQDLTLVQEPGESDAEFAERSRTTVVVSESPGDIVPNMPQITMGPQDVEEAPPPPPLPEGEGEALAVSPEEGESAEHASAHDLIEQARAANTHEELDAIEAQANERVTVLDAVEKRREEIG